jgi:4-diphosphocytidyl-2-C-methyl-D-erythritol kinase
LAFFSSSKAPAKLNLGLHILRKRPDGYHDLETVFVLIDWADRISVASSEDLSFHVDNEILASENDNLCLQAARVLLEESQISRGARIELEKQIPMGAGLGGGSTDAAATLRLLNDAWEIGFGAGRLRELGARLGSDVPVFLHETPAYATGRGEVLSALSDPDTGELLAIPYWFAVLKPDVHVSTAEAYRSIRPSDANRPNLRELVSSMDLARWRAELVNDFEAPIAAHHPQIGQALSILDDAGAEYSAMSGSGSAVFGVFADQYRAAAAAQEGRSRGLVAWSGKSY